MRLTRAVYRTGLFLFAADGDGVVVVPHAHAEPAASYARETMEGDKGSRRRLYERLGLPLDDSVK